MLIKINIDYIILHCITVSLLWDEYSLSYNLLDKVKWCFLKYIKTPSSQKVFLLVPTCLSLTVWNDLCEDFDTRRLLSHSSAENVNFLCAHWKCEFKRRV